MSNSVIPQSKYEVRRAVPSDAAAFWSCICDDDRREIESLNKYPGQEMLERSIQNSDYPRILLVRETGEALCCCGVVRMNMLSSIGNIWCVTSKYLPGHSVVFFRKSRMWVREQQEQYALLYNYVPVWHTKSLKWLRWLGFEFSSPMRLYDEMVHRVELRGL